MFSRTFQGSDAIAPLPYTIFFFIATYHSSPSNTVTQTVHSNSDPLSPSSFPSHAPVCAPLPLSNYETDTFTYKQAVCLCGNAVIDEKQKISFLFCRCHLICWDGGASKKGKQEKNTGGRQLYFGSSQSEGRISPGPA